jgi:hypothetical protein
MKGEAAGRDVTKGMPICHIIILVQGGGRGAAYCNMTSRLPFLFWNVI